MKKYFTEQEAIQNIINVLEEGYGGYYSDLHGEVFNTGDYIIFTSEAEQALTQYGVFKAITEVQKFEQDYFGEAYTDLTDPYKVANMIFYLVGENVIDKLMRQCPAFTDNWDRVADAETNSIIIDTLKEMEETHA